MVLPFNAVLEPIMCETLINYPPPKVCRLIAHDYCFDLLDLANMWLGSIIVSRIMASDAVYNAIAISCYVHKRLRLLKPLIQKRCLLYKQNTYINISFQV